MKNLLPDTNGEQSGSSMLITELNLIFAIYAKDLKKFRLGATKDEEGNSPFELLYDTEMFDIVVKLLNVSDKIKKLDTVEETDDKQKAGAKIKNIQDLTLNNTIS